MLRQIYGQVDMSQRSSRCRESPEFLSVPSDVLYDFKKDQEVVRVDYQMSASTNMFFRAVTDSQRELEPRGIFSTQTFPVMPMFREKPGQSYSFNLYNVVSPRITNEMIVGITNLDQIVDKDEGLSASCTIAISSASRSAISIRQARTAGRSILRTSSRTSTAERTAPSSRFR